MDPKIEHKLDITFLEQLKAKKFTLHSHSGDRRSFCFRCEKAKTASAIYLDICIQPGDVKMAALYAWVGTVKLSTGPFSWPNPNFRELFYNPLVAGVNAVENLHR